MVCPLTLYSFPNARIEIVFSANLFLIAIMSLFVNFEFPLYIPNDSQFFGPFPIDIAWRTFSLCVVHSRFEILLFVLIPSLWLISWCLVGFGGPNVNITRWWMYFPDQSPVPSYKRIPPYPLYLLCPVFNHFAFNLCPADVLCPARRACRNTRPFDVMEYKPSYPRIGFSLSDLIVDNSICGKGFTRKQGVDLHV